MQQKTVEDDWGMREYSTQKSVRIISRNPDMKNTPVVSCACGELIHRSHDWYVMIANGTLLCRWCANCSSCWTDCTSVNRRLVCIDGLVLCHSCLQGFGSFNEPKFRVKIEDPNNLLSPAPADRTPALPDNANNTAKTPAVLAEYKRKDRRKYIEKADKRRLLRKVFYDRQSARLPDEMNPMVTAPGYDANRGTLEKMACPGCSQVATGPAKYVVPAMPRIYHKPCFTCQSCKLPMSEGMQVAGRHFEFCTCEPPQVWCTRAACKLQRLAHHEASGSCWLGCVRPGGREQRDTDVTAQLERLRQADSKKTAQPKAN